MLITNSLASAAYRKPASRSHDVTLSADKPKGPNKALLGVAGGGVALGAGMIFKDEIMAFGGSLKDSMQPALDVATPILAGFGVGAMAGAVTGMGYGMVATMNQHDSGPLWATLGGAFGGLVVGGVVGGISAACGATPFLAIPAVIVAGAAVSYSNSRG